MLSSIQNLPSKTYILSSLAVLTALSLITLACAGWGLYLICTGVTLLGPEFTYVILLLVQSATVFSVFQGIRLRAAKFITKAFCIQVVHAICGFVFYWIILAGMMLNKETMNTKLKNVSIGNRSFELTVETIAYSFASIYAVMWFLSVILSILLDKINTCFQSIQPKKIVETVEELS